VIERASVRRVFNVI